MRSGSSFRSNRPSCAGEARSLSPIGAQATAHSFFRLFVGILVVMTVMLGAAVCIASSSDEVGVAIYVSTTGDDRNEGTIDSPLATLEGARDAIRAMDPELRSRGVTVYLRGG